MKLSIRTDSTDFFGLFPSASHLDGIWCLHKAVE